MANDYELSYTAEQIDERLGKAGNAVLHTEQNLDDQQKARARENIGAASSENAMYLTEYTETEDTGYSPSVTWKSGTLHNGKFTAIPVDLFLNKPNITGTDFLAVTPNVIYRIDFTLGRVLPHINAYVHFYEDAAEDSWINKQAFYATYPKNGSYSITFTNLSNAKYIRFSLYSAPEDGFVSSVDDMTPIVFLLYPSYEDAPSAETRIIKTRKLNIKEIYSKMVDCGAMDNTEYTEKQSYAITPKWELALVINGAVIPKPNHGTDLANKEFYKVTPNVVYKWTFRLLATHHIHAYIWWYEDATDESYIGGDRFYTKYPDQDGIVSVTSTMPSNANYVRFSVYYDGEDGADALPDSITPHDNVFHPAYVTDVSNHRTIKTDRLKVDEIYNKMVSSGLIEGNALIPDYYFATGYLTSKRDRINELYSACAGDGDAFVFVTDQHWALSAKKSPALIRYLVDETNVPRVFSGGDMADGLAKEYAAAMRAEVDRPTHYVMGNHDFFGSADGNPLCHIFHSGKENQIGPASKCYFYVDNRQQKIRYIILNSFHTDSTGALVSAYDDDQIAWLTNTALDVEDGWTVIVFTHSLYYGFGTTASLSPSPDRADEIITALDAATCDVACVIQGHMHLDRITHTPGGIPVVATTCDKYSPWIDNGTDMEPWITESRTEGTITEQAFDVVVFNKTARRLTFVRIGAPADNWIDGATTGTVEERVVTY